MVRLLDHFLLRVAGLPFEALAVLACPQTLATTRQLENLERILAGQSAGLCDRLYGVISGQTNREGRRALLGVRRAIHNGRRPEAADWEQALTLITDGPLRRDLHDWEGLVCGYHALLAAGEERVQQDLAQVRRRLRQTWQDPAFQTGLLMSQPLLYRRLVAYLQAEGELPRRERQLEKAALAYFYRMATKTSPFSTFTLTGVGQIGAGPDEPVADGPMGWQSDFALNAAVVERLALRLRAQPHIQMGLRVRVNDTLQADGDQIQALQTRLTDPDGVRVISLQETLVSVPRTGLLQAILALVAGEPDLTLWGLTSRLQALAGDTANGPQITAYVEKLLNAGLLQPVLDYEVNDSRALLSLGQAAGGELADRCARVVALVDALGAQTPSQQEQTLAQVGAEVAELFGGAGGKPPALGEQGLVHHDCLLDGAITLPQTALGQLQEDLARITRLLPLFNPSRLLQEAVRAFFLEHYGAEGRCEHLLPFYRHFYAECYSQMGEQFNTWDPVQYSLAGSAAPAVRAAAEVRSEFMRELLAQVSAPGIQAVAIPADRLDRFGDWAAGLRSRAAPLSAGYFGQLLDGGPAGPALVLNQAVPGYGTYLARFGAEPDQGSARGWLVYSLREALAQLVPGAEVAELVGIFGFNGQIHPRLTARGLVYPGEPCRDGVYRIPWSELAVTFDQGMDLPVLVSKSTGRRIVPVHAGPLSPHLTPAFFRFLSSFGPAFVPDFALLDMFEHLRAGAEPQVRHYARLTAGQVVLLRETWCIPPAAALPPVPHEGDLDYFRRLRHWARALGLPMRVFVVPVRLVDYLRQNQRANNLRRLYKPFYVDFDDFLSSQIFRRFTEGLPGVTLTVTEMLPQPEQLYLKRTGRGYVAEVLFEVYEAGG